MGVGSIGEGFWVVVGCWLLVGGVVLCCGWLMVFGVVIGSGWCDFRWLVVSGGVVSGR